MRYGKTKVILCNDNRELGARAAADVAARMRELLEGREQIRVVFAAGESQMTFLEHIYTMVPLGLKRPILEKLFALHAPTPALPASVLLDVDSRLYVDRDSCPR